MIDLHRVLAGQERVVGEVGPDQHEEIGLLGGFVARAVAEQAAHADAVGVVVLDPLLAAQRVPDRALQPAGQFPHLGVRALVRGVRLRVDDSYISAYGSGSQLGWATWRPRARIARLQLVPRHAACSPTALTLNCATGS